jgi:hypothetical protein
VVTQLLDARRLDRITLGGQMLAPADAYPLPEYLGDVRRALLGPGGAPLDANRRQLQRIYLERLEALLSPPAAPAGGNQPGGGAGQSRTLPALLTPPNVRRTDLSALARAELRSVRETARANATTSAGIARAHWNDLADRVDGILDRPRGR